MSRHAYTDTWAKYYKDCEQQPDEELAGRMANYGIDESKMHIARIVLESRQMKRQHDHDKEQMRLQHEHDNEQTQLQNKLNKKNIDLQHSLNLQIFMKQRSTSLWTTGIMAASTVLAALAGAYLAYALMQIQKPIPTKKDSTQSVQLQTAATTSVPEVKTKREKSPSHASTKISTLDSNKAGPVGRSETRP